MYICICTYVVIFAMMHYFNIYVDPLAPPPPSWFNEAILVLLPKKVTPGYEQYGKVYEPKNMRPLSIVGCFNRLLPNAFQAKLASVTQELIDQHQRGFLSNRLIAQHIIEVDMEAKHVYVRDLDGAIILFDFQAAFPSLSHDYLWYALEKWGIPPEVVCCYRKLYHGNTHKINIQGVFFESINVESGVRQGCPLSPLLFLLCIEPLLCFLGDKFPEASVKAFADDVAMVLPDVASRWADIITLFTQFADVSGLHIHPSKTILIPLGSQTPAQVKACPWFAHSDWSAAPVQLSAKYLGVFVGPGATHEDSYAGPIAKMKLRAKA